MAKINPIKVKQEAEKEERAGRLDRAIALYRQAVEAEPDDWNTIKKIGDLYARSNDPKHANAEYAKVAVHHADEGFLLKAIAVWKQINRLDPSSLEPYLNLAELYAKQGLMVEAKGQYQVVVDEFLKRGKTRDAGEALKKIAEIDPSDLKVRSKLADLYQREGSSEKAVEEHVAIAEELHRKGHLAEALQVLEKGLKVDPKSARLRLELARVHLVQRSYEKAIVHLEEARKTSPADKPILLKLGEAYIGARKVAEAEAVFSQLLNVDPNDVEAMAQMGGLRLQQGNADGAFECFATVADRLVDKREGERAVTVLRQILRADHHHVKTLSKLVEVYRAQRKDAETVATYSQLTEAYLARQQFDQAASILEILVDLEPQNEQHRSKLQWVKSHGAGGAQMEAGSDIEIDGLEPSTSPFAPVARPARAVVSAAMPTTAHHAPPAAPGRRAVTELSGPQSDDDKEFIEEHLSEGRVFRKYGLTDKSADQFEAIVGRFPDHIEARQELRDLYKEKSQNEKAAEQAMALAEIARLRGDAAGAAKYEAEARDLQPELAAAPAAAKPAKAAAPRPQAAAVLPTLDEEHIEVEEGGLEPDESGLDLDDDGLNLGLTEEEEELPVSFVEEEEHPGSPLGEDDELDFSEEAFAPPRRPAEIPMPRVALEDAARDEGFDLEELTPAPAPPPRSARQTPAPRPSPAPRSAPPPPAPPPARVSAPLVVKKSPAPAPAKSGIPPELDRLLREVEEYVSLGFVDDAKEAISEIEARYASHPAVARKLAELGIEPTGPSALEPEDLLSEAPPPPRPAVRSAPERPPARFREPSPDLSLDDAFGELGLQEPEPEPEPEAAEDAFDLESDLGDLFAPHAAVAEPEPPRVSSELEDSGLAEMFAEFRKGVDRQLGKEDYDTRYNLGIAYKEMGLIDEAIGEFQLAAKDERLLLACCSMLGICFMEKGMPLLAVKWFDKGLEAVGRSEEEYRALRYDLASAHEAAGDSERALDLFTEVYADDSSFRDVGDRVRALTAGRH